MTFEDTVKMLSEKMLQGKLAPWKAEDAAREEGLAAPEHITAGVQARRMFIETKSGQSFRHIVLPDRPYHTAYRCPQDQSL